MSDLDKLITDSIKNNDPEEKIEMVLEEIAALKLKNAKDMHSDDKKRDLGALRTGVAGAIISGGGAAINNYVEYEGQPFVDIGGDVIRSMSAGFIRGAALVASVWGVARITSEVVQQVTNGDNANISGNFTKSMESLKESEMVNFNISSNSFKILEKLETKILAEGNKWAPDLNIMKKDLLKSQILRQSILDANGISSEARENLVAKSTEVINSFEAWVKVQKGRSTPIVTFVSNLIGGEGKTIPDSVHNR